MSPIGKNILCGALVTSATPVISVSNGRTLSIAIMIGVAVTTWYQDRRR